MPKTDSTYPHEQFWITEKGRHDLLTAETCDCNVRLVGLLVSCDGCGTIYGHVGDLSRAQVREEHPLTFKEHSLRHR